MLEAANIGLLTAFLAGIISFLSPCVLPLVPGYLTFMAGRSLDELKTLEGRRERLAVLGLSLSFVLGFSTVFIILGASATALGRLLLIYKQEANFIGGLIVIAFGLFMTGLVTPRWMQSDKRLVHRLETPRNPFLSYVLGLAFAFGWTPCIGPILGGILTMSASSSGVLDGMTLLAIYSLGLGVPFLATALFMNHFLAQIKRLGRWSGRIHITGGVIMILMGVAMITGKLGAFSYWLLDAFPSLGRIG